MAESQSQGSEVQVSEAQIAVHWREEDYYYPPPKFVAQANAKDPAIYDRFSEERFPGCFKEYADLLTWDEPWHTTLDTSNPPFWKWFVGGQLTAHKAKADEALAAASEEGQEVDKVLVWRRHPGRYASQTPMAGGRDVFVDELLADYRGRVVEPVSMPAEAPLFLMYTSGTTGRPKGCQHSTGGYL